MLIVGLGLVGYLVFRIASFQPDWIYSAEEARAIQEAR